MKQYYKKIVYLLIVSSFTSALYCSLIKNNHDFLAPKSDVANLLLNEERIDLYSLSLEQIKSYFQIKRPDFVNIQEKNPLNKNEPLRIVRKITYEINNYDNNLHYPGRYDGPTSYIMYLSPESKLTDEGKLNLFDVNDRIFSGFYREAYYKLLSEKAVLRST